MMKLAIEGLKPMYATLQKSIECQPCDEDRESALYALNEMSRLIICTTTTYEGMTAPQLVMNIEEDLRYVSGQMTQEEEEARIKFHWDLIEQQNKELLEFMEQQRQERGREKK